MLSREAPRGADRSTTTSQSLKRKVDAGAEFLVSQLFFDNAHFFEFERRARAAGIAVPMLPGLMPITNFGQIERFVAMCGATIPPKLRVEMEARKRRREGGRGSRRGLRVHAGARAAAGRRSGNSLLHAQSFAGDARDRLVAARRERVAPRVYACEEAAVLHLLGATS